MNLKLDGITNHGPMFNNKNLPKPQKEKKWQQKTNAMQDCHFPRTLQRKRNFNGKKAFDASTLTYVKGFESFKVQNMLFILKLATTFKHVKC